MSTFYVKVEVDFSCMLILLLDWCQLYFETYTLTKMGQIFGQIAEKPDSASIFELAVIVFAVLVLRSVRSNYFF